LTEENVTITDGKVVQFHYTLADPDGNVLDTSDGSEPLAYLHGADNIVTGLEKQLAGRKVGDAFDAVVPPAEGYGERQGPGAQAVPRSAFPDEIELMPGMHFLAADDDGNETPLWVVGIQDDNIFVDVNHPLAGVELRFKVEIASIRDASDEEKAHGHPHGPGGHHHPE
jgi:FKBP-type peptidyl-prolyl cis-trans isomerase SlyD